MEIRRHAPRSRLTPDDLRSRQVTEREFLQQIRTLARTMNWLCYHTHDSRRSEPGFPDLVLTKGARLIFAELKTDIGKTTNEQIVWMASLEATGAEVYIWRPREFDRVVSILT